MNVNPIRIIQALARRSQSWWTGVLNWGGVMPRGIRSLGGIDVNPDSALALTAYYAAINVIATDIASLPLQVYRRRAGGGRDEVRDDPRWELLAVSPDGETTAMRWRQAWLGHALGWGNGYAEVEFDKGGIPLGLHLLDAATTCPERRPQDKVLFYRTSSGTLSPYRTLHLAGFGYDGLKGYTPAILAREAIGLGLAAEAFGSTFFGNGTHVGGVLKTAKVLKPDALKNLRSSIEAMHAGPRNAHRFLILEEGMEWVKSSVDPEAAQFLAARQFQVVEIARMFRVPPHKIGDYSQSHLANVEAANIDYFQTTLMPWCRAIEQELNRKLFTPADRAKGFYVEHDMRAFLRGDAASRATFYSTLFNLASISPNEIRENENMNPITGGNVYLTPLNMTTVDKAGQQAPGVTDAANAQPAN